MCVIILCVKRNFWVSCCGCQSCEMKKSIQSTTHSKVHITLVLRIDWFFSLISSVQKESKKTKAVDRRKCDNLWWQHKRIISQIPRITLFCLCVTELIQPWELSAKTKIKEKRNYMKWTTTEFGEQKRQRLCGLKRTDL